MDSFSLGAPSPFGRALIRAPDHLISVLFEHSIGPLQSDGEILAGVPILRGSGRSFEEEQVDVQRPGGQDIVDFMYRCRPRQELDRLLGVPEGRPRGVVFSYRPTQVFQDIVEKSCP